jgi:hypothetical protein
VELLCSTVLKRYVASLRPPPGHSHYSWVGEITSTTDSTFDSTLLPRGHCHYSWRMSKHVPEVTLRCTVLPSAAVACRFSSFLRCVPDCCHVEAVLEVGEGLHAVIYEGMTEYLNILEYNLNMT